MELHDRFMKVVKKRGKVLLVLLIALNITAFIGLFRLSINTDFNLFMPDDSTAMEHYKEMTSKFGSAEQLIFLVKSDKTNKTVVLKQFFDIQKQLDMEAVKFVNGPVPPAIPGGFGSEEIAEINEENTSR